MTLQNGVYRIPSLVGYTSVVVEGGKVVDWAHIHHGGACSCVGSPDILALLRRPDATWAPQ